MVVDYLGMFFVLYQILCNLLDKARQKAKTILFGLFNEIQTILLGHYWTQIIDENVDCSPMATNEGFSIVNQNDTVKKNVDDDTHIYQLPITLLNYITFYINYTTQCRNPDDLARLQAKNRYFNKDDLRILTHKRCINEYVYPHLDDQQFRTLSKRIEDQVSQIFKTNAIIGEGMLTVDSSYPDPDSCIFGEDENDDDDRSHFTTNQSLNSFTLVDNLENRSISTFADHFIDQRTVYTENYRGGVSGYIARGFGRDPTTIGGSAQRSDFDFNWRNGDHLVQRGRGSTTVTGYVQSTSRAFCFGHGFQTASNNVSSNKYEDYRRNDSWPPEHKNYVRSRSAFQIFDRGQRPPGPGPHFPTIQEDQGFTTMPTRISSAAMESSSLKDEMQQLNGRWSGWQDSRRPSSAIGQFHPTIVTCPQKATTVPAAEIQHCSLTTNKSTADQQKQPSEKNFQDIKNQDDTCKQETSCSSNNKKGADQINYDYDAFVPDEDDSPEDVKPEIPVPIIMKHCNIEVPVGEILPDVDFECEICHIYSPSKFAIRPFPSIVDTIEDELTQMMETYGNNGKYNGDYKVGEYCSNLFKGKYRRCRVIKANTDKGNYFVKLLYLDSGESQWISTRRLYPLPVQSRFCQRQSILCKLYGLAPCNPVTTRNCKFWSSHAVSCFQKFCSSTNGQMYAKSVCEKLTEDCSYSVSLYKTVNNRKIWAHECLLKSCFNTLIVKDDLPAKHYFYNNKKTN